jgi:hypothetical protein
MDGITGNAIHDLCNSSIYISAWRDVHNYNPQAHSYFWIRQILLEASLFFRPPLWSNGQSSWLQIRRPGFDSRHYQKKKLVGQERGPLSLVSTTEELLDRKVAAPV